MTAVSGMDTTTYDDGWLTAWNDMKRYGPYARHLRRLVLEMARPLSFRSVLDVGCGQGALLQDLLQTFPDIETFGTDFSPAGLTLAQRVVPQGQFAALD